MNLTIVFDLNRNHIATVSKDRSGLFDGKDFNITAETGKQLLAWLNSGEIVQNPILAVPPTTTSTHNSNQNLNPNPNPSKDECGEGDHCPSCGDAGRIEVKTSTKTGKKYFKCNNCDYWGWNVRKPAETDKKPKFGGVDDDAI